MGLLLELDKPTVDDLEDIELGDGHYLPRDLLNSFGQKVPSEQLARADIYSLACSILEVVREGYPWLIVSEAYLTCHRHRASGLKGQSGDPFLMQSNRGIHHSL